MRQSIEQKEVSTVTDGVEFRQRGLTEPKECSSGPLVSGLSIHDCFELRAKNLFLAEHSSPASRQVKLPDHSISDSPVNFTPKDVIGPLIKLPWTGALVATTNSMLEHASAADWKILIAQNKGNNFWDYRDGILFSPDYQRLPRWGDRRIALRTSRPLAELRNVLEAGSSRGELTAAEDRVLCRMGKRGFAKGLTCVGITLLADCVMEKFFFENDHYGFVSALADVIAVPAAGMIPAPWWLRTAGMIGLHAAGRLTDRYLSSKPPEDIGLVPASKQQSAVERFRIERGFCIAGDFRTKTADGNVPAICGTQAARGNAKVVEARSIKMNPELLKASEASKHSFSALVTFLHAPAYSPAQGPLDRLQP